MRSQGFKGGVHPAEHKALTEKIAPVKLAAPQNVVVPLSQHIGAPAKACVAKKDVVLKGQVIGTATGFVSIPIHSPVSGTVKKIDVAPHILGQKQLAVYIENDGEETWVENPKLPDWKNADPKDLIGKIQAAGIVGMGGATFPTHVKLSPPPEKKIDTLILNGAECEPYLTADHQLMLTSSAEIVGGLRVFMRALGLEKGAIAIEDNKPDAIAAMTEAADRFDAIDVVPMKVKFPQGAEKQLIKALTGREVPLAGLPMDVGCVVQNVATAQSAYRAVAYGEPLISRICTVTGDAIVKPQNLEITIGTPLQTIIDACGGLTEDVAKVIAGGPMMGIGLGDLAAPAIKGTGGLLCLSEKSAAKRDEKACIRCGTCVQHCPMGLLPTSIAMAVKHDMIEEAEKFGAMDCIECGCCSFGCPSSIPLVQYIRLGKGDIMAKRRQSA
jgi:electron transport complex protein RnfC